MKRQLEAAKATSKLLSKDIIERLFLVTMIATIVGLLFAAVTHAAEASMPIHPKKSHTRIIEKITLVNRIDENGNVVRKAEKQLFVVPRSQHKCHKHHKHHGCHATGKCKDRLIDQYSGTRLNQSLSPAIKTAAPIIYLGTQKKTAECKVTKGTSLNCGMGNCVNKCSGVCKCSSKCKK